MNMAFFKPDKNSTEGNWLVTFTFLYLGLPNLMFIIGWLQWYVALPVTLALLWSGRNVYLENRNAPMPWASSEISRKALWLLLLVTTVWLLLAGVGGVFRQFGDYDKHNAIIRELSEKAWPVLLDNTAVNHNEPAFLCYYIGFYMPIAIMSWLTDISLANFYMFIWTWIGVVLTFFWIKKLSGLRKAGLLFLLFPLLSGLDFYAGVYRLLQIVVHHGYDQSFWDISVYYGTDGTLIYNWGNAIKGKNINFHSINGVINWIPQHAMGGWLSGAMLYWEGSFKKRNTYIGLIVVLAVNISTFAAVGCGFLAVVYLFRNRFITNLSYHNLVAAPALGGVMLAFLLAHYSLVTKGFLWEFISWKTIPYLLFFFFLIEFAVYAFLIYPFYKNGRFKKDLTMVLGILLLLPLYKIGFYNDWLMDVSIPVLFVFWILVIRFFSKVSKGFRYWSMVFLIATASLTPIRTMIVSAINPLVGFKFHPIPSPEYSTWITKVDFRDEISKQYMGKTDSFFWKYLAKK